MKFIKTADLLLQAKVNNLVMLFGQFGNVKDAEIKI